jgi:hypothetical protein
MTHRALRRPIIDGVARGESFDQLYGPLVVPPEAQREAALVAAFPFDEKATDIADIYPPADVVARWTSLVARLN